MAHETPLRLVEGVILEEQSHLTLDELCGACAVHAEWVMELVAEGVLDPVGGELRHWQFTGVHLKRTGIARRLQRDLGINLAGIALALQLLDEIETLQARAQLSAHHSRTQPATT